MANILNNIVSTIFPAICVGCERKLAHQEKHICTHCRHNLPFTNFHKHSKNPVLDVFYGRIFIENATALLHYKKSGVVQKLLHQLKYKGHQEIGTLLGDMLGNQLKNTEAYQNVDIVIPVPLHKKRLRKRGYNQVTTFGKQIAAHLEATYVDTILVKVNHTKTQAFKKRTERWMSIQNSFEITDTKSLEGKHILLVDDVITTGATLEACAQVLQKAANSTISVATMSIAS